MTRPKEPEYNPDKHNSYNRELLQQELLELSLSKVWQEAKREWIVDDVYWENAFTHCLCGHGIAERCVLLNEKTQNKAIVGNCCVKQFMSHLLADMPTDAMFASIKRVKRSPDKALHKQVVSMACRRRAITAWAKGWYLKTAQKRELTHKEIGYRRHLNRKIVSSGANDADAQDPFESCMPFDGPWTLDDTTLTAAREQGKVTEWEEEFYRSNYGKQWVSCKQASIKRRVEECAQPNPWRLDAAALEQGQNSGHISAWEAHFYRSNLGKPRFTQKQAAIKWKIEDALSC